MTPKTMFTLALLLVMAGWSRPATAQSTVTRLVSGLEGASGSTVGPDGALYVTEGAAGRISRVDPQTGQVTTFASGLPRSVIGFRGPTDITFIGNTAYVIVTLVGPQFGGSDIVGIYRVDGPASFTVIADIGAFALEKPPDTPFEGLMGLQYAIEPYRGGFLVTDGHHNRVLRVTRDGHVSVFMAFDNIVPTGLARSGNTMYLARGNATERSASDPRCLAVANRAGAANRSSPIRSPVPSATSATESRCAARRGCP
jgi:DNA-binding beta-propeller fold protein YncE